MPGSYDTNVFVNCPFDSEYRPQFEAVTFAIYDCGFFPRCALEVDDSSQVRIEKITKIIRTCRLSVHDISRTQLDAVTGLPRFNMPLELGMFLGAKVFGGGVQRRKAALVLDEEQYRYQKYVSDIAGQDIRAHGGRTDETIKHVRNFLATHRDSGVILPGGDKVSQRYADFRAELGTTCADLHLNPAELTFRDLTTLIVGWLKAFPLSAGSV
jgi:hypothetical protein